MAETISLDQEWQKAVKAQAMLEALWSEPQATAGLLHQIQVGEVPSPEVDSPSLAQLAEQLNTLTDILAQLLEARQAEQEQKTRPIPLSAAIEMWLEAVGSAGRTASTLSSYRKLLSRFLGFSGDRDVASIEPENIRAFFSFLRNQNGKRLSEAYIARFFRAIRTFFNHCKKEGWIADTPMKQIKEPDTGNSEPKGIEWEDFLQLMASTRKGTLVDRRDAAIMLVMHDGGFRVGEVCELRVSDLDLKKNLIKRVHEVKVKTVRPKPITLATRQALRAWLEVRPKVKTDAVFISLRPQSYGEPLTLFGVGQMLERRAERAGVTGYVNPHSFRHGRGRDHIMSGGDTATGAKLLGHSSEKTFSNFYARFGISELQAKHAQHNSINTRLGFAELGVADEEEPLPPPEFTADIEVVRVPGQREVQRYFGRIFDDRRQVSLEDLLGSAECDPGMTERLLDYCGLNEGFGFQVVFPLAGLTVGPLPTVENHLLRVSNVMIEMSAYS